MKLNDLNFKKSCQTWHKKASSLIKRGDTKEVNEIRNKILAAIDQWREQEKSARLKTHLLSSLLVSLDREMKIKSRRDKNG